MRIPVVIALVIVVGVICGLIGIVLGSLIKEKKSLKDKESAQQQARQIINDALAEAESTKKTQLLEAKDEIHKLRSDADKEIRERRNEVQRQEKRLNQREEYLDKKADSIESKSETLNRKIKEADEKLLEIDGIKKSQFDLLERISGLSQEDARKQLMQSLESWPLPVLAIHPIFTQRQIMVRRVSMA